MKTTNLKYIAYALSALMLMQSCVVYHKTPSTVNEAVSSQKKVIVKSHVNEIFRFRYLKKEDDQLYGITKRESATAKRLYAQIKEDKSFKKMVGILLPEETIKEIHIHNKTLSTVLTIGVPIVFFGGLIAIVAIGYEPCDNYWCR